MTTAHVVCLQVSDETVKDNGESFNQIAVGGFHLPKQPAGFLSVWAISSTGDVNTSLVISKWHWHVFSFITVTYCRLWQIRQ